MTPKTSSETQPNFSARDASGVSNRECESCGAFKAEREAACTFCGLAPTAPVEASGSERVSDAIGFMENAAAMLGRAEMPAPGTQYASNWRDAHLILLAALRPQPSGETREAVARIEKVISFFAGTGADVLSSDESEQHAADLRTILALLSARPLALGGQQGVTADSLTQSVTDETMRALLSCKDVGTGRAHLAVIINALSTTPARAEAQDEGAVGEPWGYAARRVRIDGSACEAPWTPGKIGDGFYMLTVDDPDWEIVTLYAHPSPTPAADADRGMKAFNFINDLYRIKAEFPAIRLHGALKKAEALAALKSTAAKEGGE